MVIVGEHAGKIVMNLTRGEELVAILASWCKKEKISGATLSGLGAADELEVAYYNLGVKQFERHTIKEEVEILSLVGNVAMLSDKRVLHIHGTFGRKDLSTFGGHICSLRVSGACEIHLTVFPQAFIRAYDEETGLNLLCQAAAHTKE
ncbi:MAG: PPC domain-containing DNA-binding protein [Candidatus Moraniibacteriota bacterium]